MRSQYVANFMVVVVLIDTCCTCNAIDARAGNRDPSLAVLWISDICLCLYTLEAVIWVTLTGMKFLQDWMMVMDVGIVSCGWLEILLTQFTTAADVLGFRIKEHKHNLSAWNGTFEAAVTYAASHRGKPCGSPGKKKNWMTLFQVGFQWLSSRLSRLGV